MVNPFTSRLYIDTWLKHFKSENAEKTFKTFKGLSFFKAKRLPLYINIGKNLTKGIDYEVDDQAKDYKGKAFLIYDVPEYFKLPSLHTNASSSLELKSVYQYKGFALDFTDFPKPEDYIASRISAKNRRGYKSRLKRLEQCFDIRYEFLFGEVEQSYFESLFKQFHTLLSKRFSGKGVNYHHLEEQKWRFYTELVYEMLQKKQASLFTIYNGETPIGVTLNFHSEAIAFVTITVFDPDYFKFNVGKASIVKLLEWCYQQNIKIMDFSKGEFDFKYEWCNLVYNFDYHILYDSKSPKALLTANLVALFFKFKLYLREKNVNNLYRKILHKLKGGNSDKGFVKNYDIGFLDEFVATQAYETVNLEAKEHEFLKAFVYAFLFANPQPLKDLEIYKEVAAKTYIFKGVKKIQQIRFTS